MLNQLSVRRKDAENHQTMKNRVSLIVVLLLQAILVNAQFDEWFYNKTLRMDYQHSGTAKTEVFSFQEWIEEPFWGGSQVNLIDTFGYGQYQLQVLDKSTNKLLYSRGFSTLFSEWQTTAEAGKINRSFPEAVVMPYPKKDAVVIILSRNKKGVFEESFKQEFSPSDYFVRKELKRKATAFDIEVHGDASNKVDIVIIPEGYTSEQMDLFKRDCSRFAEEFFKFSPYKEYRESFNLRGVLVPSEESGTDIPKEGIWRNTAVNSRFYTFDLDRYVMTHDFQSVRDAAANAPYDQIYILVNTERYGGGAIYNFYSMSVNSNPYAGKIFIHELGHGFAGLADEYYTSAVAYNDFYQMDVEPWEPNITTLVDFDAKWKHLLPQGQAIPTIPTKENQDQMGVFEGGGYSAKGVYRPRQDCLMHTFKGSTFCGACDEAIVKMIMFYSK